MEAVIIKDWKKYKKFGQYMKSFWKKLRDMHSVIQREKFQQKGI